MQEEARTLDWLLEADNPSIRFRTLTELLGYGADDPQVRQARAQIGTSKPVAKIFSKMHPDGYWLYVDKRTNRGLGAGVAYWDYVTTHFNLAYLSELGVNRDDQRLELAVNRYLSLQQPDGDFHKHFSCLYSYNLRSFIRMGYRDDPRVERTIQLLTGTDRIDGGYLCDLHEGKRQHKPVKSCIRGSVKALMAFAELPELWATPRCQALVDYFLRRRIYFRTQQPDQPVIGEMTNTLFPFVWRASFLEGLYALSIMGYGDTPELAEAWALLNSKKAASGRYILDWTPPRAYFNPGKRKMPNKWVTLYAHLALKHKETANHRRQVDA